jgi:hypothetical protein
MVVLLSTLGNPKKTAGGTSNASSSPMRLSLENYPLHRGCRQKKKKVV